MSMALARPVQHHMDHKSTDMGRREQRLQVARKDRHPRDSRVSRLRVAPKAPRHPRLVLRKERHQLEHRLRQQHLRRK